MGEFISDVITPKIGDGALAGMGRGEPGVPDAFVWRSDTFDIVEHIAAWKESSREGAHAQGEAYLRRHYHRFRMHDGSVWTVYFLRRTPASGNPKSRWFLYTIDRDDARAPSA
ncbi:MAG: DUF6504 family protein, partial [Phycisphaerae bacterium]